MMKSKIYSDLLLCLEHEVVYVRVGGVGIS